MGKSSLSPVLITGGCGFVGSHIVSDILLKYEPTADVHVIDIKQQKEVPGATYYKCDISSRSDVEAIFRRCKPKTVFHVACPDSANVQPALFRKVNVTGTHNLLLAAQDTGTVKAFIYTCSSSVIHDNHSDLVNGDESWPVLTYPAQKRAYSLTKAEAEASILAANRANGDSSMLTASIRVCAAFGERDYTTFGKIAANARQGKAKMQIGNGQNLHDVTYISNLVDAHLLAAQGLLRAHGQPPPSPATRVDGEAFFISNDEHILFWEHSRAIAASVGFPVKKEDIWVVPIWVAYLSALIAEWYVWLLTGGKQVPIITREAVRLVVINRTFNIDKAKRVLGYRPKITVAEGLARTGKWFVEEEKKTATRKRV
ncbi:hypothetical protein VPNG_08911 [Cytospora leucostoma]|uniref:3-beta hydroxysteroid dehydrogenase/isomerase domain-containing protein n=1 Tax=Cytospora leucostoma TaxID=1230097 RepID=A0A423VWW6_9PEZI|nr:hypothetical protein VPNG_08911 [Cytospora leucostoma]